MADAAVTFLLENVGQLVKHQVGLIVGAEHELEQLKADLNWLKAFLRDAAKMPNKPEGFRDIESQIRDVVYDAEDVIDSCMVHAAASKSRANNPFRRLTGANRVRGLAEEVRSLREREVIQMVETARRFQTTAMITGSQPTHEDPPSKPPKLQTIREKNVVGFEKNEKEIIRYLDEWKEKLDVISIVGMPGLGKTTLAWKIFKSDYVNREFPNRIWVYVTQTPNIKTVFLNILKEFTKDNMSGLSDRALIETVQFYLKERKFILVLDDVWTTEAWDAISVVLSGSNNMSKVIVTSRERSVGAKASAPREPYKLPFLETQESWELLQYEVFGKLDECPDYLKDDGQCIALSCHGLPLSIVVIGGILVEQSSKNEGTIEIREAWHKVSGDVTNFLENDEKQQVSDIVELSYNRLPNKLRECFLYLAVFPEDYEISAWKLTRLWIAEGFIQGASLEEAAEENLKDLINRNLVTVGKRNPKGGVKTCTIHDVIRAFCSSKVSQEQHKFFREMKFSNGDFYPRLSEISKHRRLCIHFDLENFLSHTERKKAAHIRSLLCFYKDHRVLPKEHVPTMVDDFGMLRVLEAELIKLDQMPKGVTKLFHLRYITLSIDTLNALSKDFSNLWNLQTLLVYTKKNSLIIKANMRKMTQLRHLKTNTIITEIAKGDGEGCKNLQTVSRVSPEICTTDFFNMAPNLKRVGIQGKLAGLFSSNSMGMLNQLEKLKLVNTSHDSESRRLMRFPDSKSWFPPRLKMLTMENTELDWEHMSTLGKIATLQVLKLKRNAFTGMTWEAVGGGFPALHFLLIADTNLFNWKASSDSFPNLMCLVLKKCKNFSKIPEGVVERLEKLEIEHLPKSAVESAKKIEENRKSIQGTRGRFTLTVGAGCV